jgi:hypothetical protein
MNNSEYHSFAHSTPHDHHGRSKEIINLVWTIKRLAVSQAEMRSCGPCRLWRLHLASSLAICLKPLTRLRVKCSERSSS